MELVDITLPLRPGMLVYPGDPELALEALAELREGDRSSYALSRLTLSTHTGTHVDAPAHFIPGGAGIDEVPLALLCGPARVVDLSSAGPRLDAETLAGLDLDGVERLLIRTESGQRLAAGAPFDETHAHLTAEAARFLRDRTAVRLVGVDYLSIEGGGSASFEVHRTLLGASPPFVIVESLDLSGAAPGDWELFCLPLRLRGADGAPARAILLRR